MKKITDGYIDVYLKNVKKTRDVSDEYIQTYRDKIRLALQNGSSDNFNWATHQTYLALGVAVVTAAQLQIDATPIEGFSPDVLNQILGLKTDEESTTLMLTLGYRDEKEDHLANLPKVRLPKEDLVEVLD